MLDFKNIREVSSKMLVKARTYTEAFWQKIFDNLDFTETEIGIKIFEFCDETPFPKEWDYLEIFETLYFIVEYNCYGDIRVIFYPDIPCEDVAFRLSSECLLDNNFIQVNERTFILSNVNKI